MHRDRTNLKLQETTTLKPKCWVLHCCASLHSGSNRSLFVLIIEILGKLPCIDRRAQMVCTVIKLNNVQNADELTSAIMLSSKKSGVPNAGNSFISGWAALWTLWICYLEPVHAVRGRQWFWRNIHGRSRDRLLRSKQTPHRELRVKRSSVLTRLTLAQVRRRLISPRHQVYRNVFATHSL